MEATADRLARAMRDASDVQRRLAGTYERMAETLETTALLADEHADRNVAGGLDAGSERREAHKAREQAEHCRELARRWD